MGIPVLCATLLACSDAGFSGFEDELVLESRHFRLHVHEDSLFACDGTLTELESHFEAFHDFFGIAFPDDQRIDYFLFRDRDELRQSGICRHEHALGCVVERRVYTALPLHGHELVHAYFAETRPPRIFEEGMAEVTTCNHPGWGIDEFRALEAGTFDELAPFYDSTPVSLRELARLSWKELASWPYYLDAEQERLYQRAGTELVRYLINEFGMAKVVEHLRSARSSTDPALVTSDFEDVFDLPLSEAWSAALRQGIPGGPCYRVHACAGAPLVLGETLDVAPECGVTEVRRVLELEEPAALIGTARGLAAPEERPFVASCDGSARIAYWTWGFEDLHATELPTGRYAVVSPTPASKKVGTLTLEAVESFNNCERALENPLHYRDPAWLRFVVPQDGTTKYLALDVAPARTVTLYTMIVPHPAQLCVGCGEAAECVDFETEPMSLEVQGTRVLKLRTESQPWSFFNALMNSWE